MKTFIVTHHIAGLSSLVYQANYFGKQEICRLSMLHLTMVLLPMFSSPGLILAILFVFSYYMGYGLLFKIPRLSILNNVTSQDILAIFERRRKHTNMLMDKFHKNGNIFEKERLILNSWKHNTTDPRKSSYIYTV